MWGVCRGRRQEHEHFPDPETKVSLRKWDSKRQCGQGIQLGCGEKYVIGVFIQDSCTSSKLLDILKDKEVNQINHLRVHKWK